jgi:hypothetical protein
MQDERVEAEPAKDFRRGGALTWSVGVDFIRMWRPPLGERATGATGCERCDRCGRSPAEAGHYRRGRNLLVETLY